MRVPGTNFDYARPQFFATLLLLVYLGQALLLAAPTLNIFEVRYLQYGDQVLKNGGAAWPVKIGSPLPALMAVVPLKGLGSGSDAIVQMHRNCPDGFVSAGYSLPPHLRWSARLPFVLAGLALGAAIWYVGRRLYGDAGGYVALALYACSPFVFSARVDPFVLASLGMFGTLFNGLATAHTLYAPTPVSPRRLLMLIASIALALGSVYIGFLPWVMTFAFLLYVVPERRREVALLYARATGIALLVILASYGFNLAAMLRGMLSAEGAIWGGAPLGRISRAHVEAAAEHWPVAVLSLGALLVFLSWRRARYFGNLAPLLVAAALALVPFWSRPQGYLFSIVDANALPFLFLFIGGVTADLLDTRFRRGVLFAVIVLLLAEAVIWAQFLHRIATFSAPCSQG